MVSAKSRESGFCKKGFTLIELLVVISIIAVLLSILMPSLKKAKDKVRSVICRSNLKHWAIPFALYAEDNNGKFMRGWMDTMGSGEKQWMNQLRPYYSGVGNFRLCPMTPVPKEDNCFGGTYKAWANLSGTASNGIFKGEYGSYAMNDWAHNPPPNVWLWNSEYSDYWLGPYNLRNPRNIPLFCDSVWTGALPKDTNPPPEWEDYAQEDYSITGQMWRVCIKRHQRRGINMLFMDFSIDEVGLKRLWRLKWHKSFDTNNYWTTPDADWPDWMRSLSDN